MLHRTAGALGWALKLMALGAACAGAVAAGYALRGPAPAAPPPDPSELEQLRERLGVVERQAHASQAASRAAWFAAATRAVESEQGEARDRVSTEEEAASEGADVAESDPVAWGIEHHAAAEAQLSAEPRDPDWSHDTELWIEQTLTEHEMLAGLSVRRVDCKTTICRVEVFHESPETRLLFNHVASIALAKRLPMSSIRPSEDERVSVAVFARTGHELPGIGG